MKRFEFRKREIELDIAGVRASLPLSPAHVQKIRDVPEKIERAKAAESVEAGAEILLGVLDELLGMETMDKVEAAREMDIYDCIDLLLHVLGEINGCYAAKEKEYLALADGYAAPMPLTAAGRRRSNP